MDKVANKCLISDVDVGNTVVARTAATSPIPRYIFPFHLIEYVARDSFIAAPFCHIRASVALPLTLTPPPSFSSRFAEKGKARSMCNRGAVVWSMSPRFGINGLGLDWSRGSSAQRDRREGHTRRDRIE